MFSFFKRKKKEEVQLSEENFMKANPQDFGWDLVSEETVPSVRGKRIAFKDKTQESRVEAIIRENGIGMTPNEVEEEYNKLYDTVPLTSIRRAMSKLTDYGILNMSGEKKNGEIQ